MLWAKAECFYAHIIFSRQHLVQSHLCYSVASVVCRHCLPSVRNALCASHCIGYHSDSLASC